MAVLSKAIWGVLLMGSCLLSSCYTNINQRIAGPYREHSGFDLYYAEGWHPQAQSPSLYRCGDDWYLAAVRCKVKTQCVMPMVYGIGSGWYDRNETAPEYFSQPHVVYHKITPSMASRLQKYSSYVKKRITDGMMAEDMKRAGGEWVEALPPGTQVIPAPLLAGSLTAAHWVLVETTEYNAPWYINAAAGATFVAADIPCSAICTAVALVGCTAASPVLLYLYLTDH